MAAHKYWRARFFLYTNPSVAVSPGPIELSEFQLYNGATRLDAAITPTTDVAPTSGSLASLKDNLTTAGVYWADTESIPVSLYWEFPTPVEVDGIVIGHRTTAVRAVHAVAMVGSDALVNSPRTTVRCCGMIKFVSATKSDILPLTGPAVANGYVNTLRDFRYGMDADGVVADTVKTKATPVNLPTHCKVRLVRDIDGKVIQEQWTDPVTGAYSFEYVDRNYTHTVIAIHPLGSFRAVIADRLTPGLMP